MFVALMATFFILLSALLVILRMSSAFKQNSAHLKSLQDIDRSMLSGLSHKGIMNAIVDKLNTALNTDAAAILVTKKNDFGLKTLVASNLSKEFQKYIIESDNGFLSAVIDNRKSLIIAQISRDEDEEFLKKIKNEGFISYLGSPIIMKGGLPIGVLTLYNKKPRRYSKRDIGLINAISSQIGIALDRAQLIERIQEMNFESVRALVEAIEIRDPYTRGHSIQVADLAVKLSHKLGFTERELNLIEFAGLLHDVGKIAIPETILQKRSALTAEEWKVIRRHTFLSAKMIEPIRNLRAIQSWVLYHHERWDGKGYPEGRKEKQIPLQSRILAVCDTYSAMTGDRPYRKALSLDETRCEIKRVAGSQLDPHIVDLFLKLHPDEFLLRKNSRRKQGT